MPFNFRQFLTAGLKTAKSALQKADTVDDNPAAQPAGEAQAQKSRIEGIVSRYWPEILVAAVFSTAVIVNYARHISGGNPYDQGLAHLADTQSDAAIMDFQKALKRNPSDIASRFQLGLAYHQKGMVDQSLAEYQAAGASARNIANFSYHNSGIILQNKGLLDLAATAYRNSLGANPSAGNSLFNLLLIYETRQEYDKGLQACLTYLEANPQDTAYVFRAGQFAEKLNRRDLAARYYRKALSLDPKYSPARDRLRALRAG